MRNLMLFCLLVAATACSDALTRSLPVDSTGSPEAPTAPSVDDEDRPRCHLEGTIDTLPDGSIIAIDRYVCAGGDRPPARP